MASLTMVSTSPAGLPNGTKVHLNYVNTDEMVQAVNIVDSSGNILTTVTPRVEDAAWATGHDVAPVGAVRNDTPGLLGTPEDGDYTVLQTDDEGNLRVAFPYLVRTGDAVQAALESSVLMQGTSERTVARAAISAASSGDNTLVAAQGASAKIRVLSYTLVAASSVDVRFEDGAGGTALSGVMTLDKGITVAYSPHGHFEGSANTLLNLELGAAVQVSGHLSYIVVS